MSIIDWFQKNYGEFSSFVSSLSSNLATADVVLAMKEIKQSLEAMLNQYKSQVSLLSHDIEDLKQSLCEGINFIILVMYNHDAINK